MNNATRQRAFRSCSSAKDIFPPYTPERIALDKWARLICGEKIIVSDRDLDLICEHLKDDDGPQAQLFFGFLVSIPNPKQIGTIRTYLAWLK